MVESVQCWVYGQSADEPFDLSIWPRTETIEDLRNIIKEHYRARFRGIGVERLDIYSFSTSGYNPNTLKEALMDWTPEGKPPIQLLTPISNLGKHVIIVDGPTPDVTLNCWVHGEGPNNVFSVKISSMESVGTLRKAIKEKKPVHFGAVDADTLVLYKVSIPYSQDIKNVLQSLTLLPDEQLSPLLTLSEVFPDAPPEHVHVVIDAPTLRHCARLPLLEPPITKNVRDLRTEFIACRTKRDPSPAVTHPTFSEHQDVRGETIYCGRPSDACDVIPPTLLDPTFGKFLDDCEMRESTPDDNSLTEELRVKMSDFYSKESDRANVIRGILSERGIHFGRTGVDDYFTRGDMSVDGHCYAIAQFRNEVGLAGAEPYRQLTLYYLESARKHADREDTARLALPCIFIIFFGPYISFAGAAWNTRPVIQPLSIVLPMHYHPLDESTRKTVACHLGAFKEAIGALKKYYQDLPKLTPLVSPDHPRLFPYPTEFTSLASPDKKRFKYIHQPFTDKLIFFGALDDETEICIKFVRSYSMEAHRICASNGGAPRLHGFESLPGGWFMVIMDRLFEAEYVKLYDVMHSLPGDLIKNIRETLKKLHEENYVHGDVRDSNIMVSKRDETKFMFLDFDWAGKINEVQYPMNVDRAVDLWRPDEAVDGAMITAEHDMLMLDYIQRRYRMEPSDASAGSSKRPASPTLEPSSKRLRGSSPAASGSGI